MPLNSRNQNTFNNSNQDPSNELLNFTDDFLREFVKPIANQIDRDSEALKKTFQAMADRSLLGLRIPKSWGGREVNEETYRRFQQLIPRYSGALAFLQTQHQSAAEFISYSQNQSLRQQYLPQMSSGLAIGIGFSHLRRKGEPLLKAVPTNGGYYLNGQVPWVTGFKFFSEFIVAALLPDQQAVYGIVPFRDQQNLGGIISFSEPMELAAMASTNTVSSTIHDWFLSEESIIKITPPGAIHENDHKNVLNHGFASLGCAEAGLSILEAAALTKQLPCIHKAFDSLNQELSCCQAAMFEALSLPTIAWEKRLQLRAWAIELSLRCASAAVTVSGGAANYQDHPAQRVYREALVFTVSGQTTSVLEGTLERLIR